MTLQETLQWMAGPSTAVAWLGVVYLILSYKPVWFEKLTKEGKLAVTLALNFLPPIAALAILTYVTPSVLVTLEPWYALISALAMAFLAQQGIHIGVSNLKK